MMAADKAGRSQNTEQGKSCPSSPEVLSKGMTGPPVINSHCHISEMGRGNRGLRVLPAVTGGTKARGWPGGGATGHASHRGQACHPRLYASSRA